MSTTRFPAAISAISPSNGQILNGDSGQPVAETWRQEATPAHASPRLIDISWYEEQRVKLRSVEHQVALVNEQLANNWYKIIKRSLADLPIQAGGRSLQNPEYGANLRNIATALAIAPRTLAGYRTAVSRVRNDAHFREAIKGLSWSQFVFSFGAGPMRRLMDTGSADSPAPSGAPPVKRRFVVQVPTNLADFLIENGLEAPDVTAVVVAHLRQPKVHKELLKMFRLAQERTA